MNFGDIAGKVGEQLSEHADDIKEKVHGAVDGIVDDKLGATGQADKIKDAIDGGVDKAINVLGGNSGASEGDAE